MIDTLIDPEELTTPDHHTSSDKEMTCDDVISDITRPPRDNDDVMLRSDVIGTSDVTCQTIDTGHTKLDNGPVLECLNCVTSPALRLRNSRLIDTG